MNPLRLTFGIIYCVFGLALILLFCLAQWSEITIFLASKPVLMKIIWCIGWSAFGVGVGLINTRDHGAEKDQQQTGQPVEKSKRHYFGYYGFVLLIASLLAATAVFHDNPDAKYYSLSALLGLISGFLGYKLNEIASGFLGQR